MERLMSLTHANGQISGRATPHLNDIIKALQDMNYTPVHLERSLAQSRHLKSIIEIKYDQTRESTVRMFEPPRRTGVSDQDEEEENKNHENNVKEIFEQLSSDGEDEVLDFVPKHLPPLPPKHSYKQTAVYVDKPTDPRKIREKRVQDAKLVEGALRNLLKVAGEMGEESMPGTDEFSSNVYDALPPLVNYEMMAYTKRKREQETT